MSMNLYVEATRKATVKVKGKRKIITDRIKFGLWQTPTPLTYEVLELPAIEQQINAYIKWAKSVSKPYEDNVYDFSAPLDENFEYPVIGRKMVNPAQEHTVELHKWLKMCEDEDYTVKFYMV